MNVMRSALAFLAAGFWILAPANAQDRPVVVELFTSQGCSSCPPADKFLQQLAGRDDVVALALHVDYWDYIGWADVFAKPAYTARQRAYAKAKGKRMVYTPQIVINGKDHVVGNRPMDVSELIQEQKRADPYVGLDVTRNDTRLTIRAETLMATGTPMTVQMIRYRPEATVDITRGENAGQVLSYANIVTELTELSLWDGRAPLQLETKITGPDPVVVLVQQTGHGPIEAVARLR